MGLRLPGGLADGRRRGAAPAGQGRGRPRPAPAGHGPSAASGTGSSGAEARPDACPGRLRRRLTVAFVLVAGVSRRRPGRAGRSCCVRQARLSDSVDRAKRRPSSTSGSPDDGFQAPERPQTSTGLLTSFEQQRLRHRGAAVRDGHMRAAPAPRSAGVPAAPSAAVAARVSSAPAGREDRRADLLLAGGRVPGRPAELYVVVVESTAPGGPVGSSRTCCCRAGSPWSWSAGLVGALLAGGRWSRSPRPARPRAHWPRDSWRRGSPWGRRTSSARGPPRSTRWPTRSRPRSRRSPRLRRGSDDSPRTSRTSSERRSTALVSEASLLREHLDQMPADARRAGRAAGRRRGPAARLVEDLMEISRLDAGAEDGRRRGGGPRPLVAGIVAAAVGRTGASRSPARVGSRTDRRRSERVHVEPGRKRGGARRRRDPRAHRRRRRADGRSRSRRGPGIPAAFTAAPVRRFHKVDPARSGRGSGLGLAIARHNATCSAGGWGVHSEPGVLTRFRLDLPAEPRQPAPDGADEPAYRGRRPARRRTPAHRMRHAPVRLTRPRAHRAAAGHHPRRIGAAAHHGAAHHAATTAGRARSVGPAHVDHRRARPETVTVELWYVRDGRIAPTRRTRPATVATSRLARASWPPGRRRWRPPPG